MKTSTSRDGKLGMKLLLKQCGSMSFEQQTAHPIKDGYLRLKVLCCAVCRTDAKMWRQGHRDLKLPRVLGHEIAALDESTGQIYTVWPGQACGKCRYCGSGRENLCEEMKIIGFHSDGGFAEYVSVPKESLIPVAREIDPLVVSFCEPVACVINGFSFVELATGSRVVIYGGGVLGLVAGLYCYEKGMQVTIIEQSQEKIGRVQEFCTENAITLCKDSVEADFDLAMNCCDSHIAFSLCITKLRKGGQLVYFSGLEKNEEIDTNLLNLVHYKELEIYGAYGPRRDHMREALLFIKGQQPNLEKLVDRVISLSEVEKVLPEILSGRSMKYVVDFRERALKVDVEKCREGDKNPELVRNHPSLPESILRLCTKIQTPDREMRDRAQKKVDLKTKPLGALGRLESLAVQLSALQSSLNPVVECRRLFVFAGDHGVVEEGVSAFPSKVTVQMVENFLDGGAAINVFCSQYDIELNIVDMGVNGDFKDHPQLIKKKVAYGTENFSIRTAMNRDQAVSAIENGASVFLEKNRERRCELVGMGEMGIGNTSSAAAIICAVSGLCPEEVVGRGTGVDDRGLMRKIEVLEKTLALHHPLAVDGLELLRAVGGYELGGICGAVLAAASEGCCVVLDGVISTAAGLLAYLICPEVKEYLVAGHRSVEIGQKAALEIMDLQPVVDLGFRLGEGTGAAVTMNLVDLSCKMMRDMASFEEAGVDSKNV
jgi:nicotinate-nucleotide--dimethylbenzimidazole phosphoribosyltransferase